MNVSLFFYLFTCLLVYQVSLQELEQQRPLLEKQVTAAQNLKNKTSNQHSRNAITERSMSQAFTDLFFCEKLYFPLRNNAICYRNCLSLKSIRSYVDTQLST